MATPTRRGGKKNRKLGRNKTACDRYRREGRREKNKARNLARCKKQMEKARAKRAGRLMTRRAK